MKEFPALIRPRKHSEARYTPTSSPRQGKVAAALEGLLLCVLIDVVVDYVGVYAVFGLLRQRPLCWQYCMRNTRTGAIRELSRVFPTRLTSQPCTLLLDRQQQLFSYNEQCSICDDDVPPQGCSVFRATRVPEPLPTPKIFCILLCGEHKIDFL